MILNQVVETSCAATGMTSIACATFSKEEGETSCITPRIAASFQGQVKGEVILWPSLRQACIEVLTSPQICRVDMQGSNSIYLFWHLLRWLPLLLGFASSTKVWAALFSGFFAGRRSFFGVFLSLELLLLRVASWLLQWFQSQRHVANFVFLEPYFRRHSWAICFQAQGRCQTQRDAALIIPRPHLHQHCCTSVRVERKLKTVCT